MEGQKRGKTHFSILGLLVAWGRGENESVMALTGFVMLQIIATVPSDNIFFQLKQRRGHWIAHKQAQMVKNG